MGEYKVKLIYPRKNREEKIRIDHKPETNDVFDLYNGEVFMIHSTPSSIRFNVRDNIFICEGVFYDSYEALKEINEKDYV